MAGILISGVTGLVGRYVLEALLEQGEEELHTVARQPLPAPFEGNPRIHQHHVDITDAAAVDAALREARPVAVIHPAAIADVDVCERDQALALAVNRDGAANMARACAAAGAHLIHVSTDYVFDGTPAHPGLYDESATPNPVNFYGQTKLEAERLVSELCTGQVSCAICRTALVYGLNPAGRQNFIIGMVNDLRAGRQVRALTDQQNTPTHAANLAKMLAQAAERRVTGIYHTAGAELITRYQLALLVAQTFDLDTSLIIPLTSAELGQRARRPLLSGLRVERAERDLGVQAWTMEQGLAQIKSILG